MKHFATFLILALGGLGLGVGLRFTTEKSDFRETAVLPTPASPSPEISLIFVGDIILDRAVKSKVEKIGNGDFSYPFLKIADVLQGVDIAAGNLEGPISDKGENVGSIYSFRMPPEALRGLTFAGFDVLFLANNHIGDWGAEALADTVSNLENAGIAAVGAGRTSAEAYAPEILEVKGVKIAFLAFSDFFVSGAALAEETAVTDAILGAKATADVVVVAYHFGEEYLTEPNERQMTLARLAIDAGADLVIGSHPHVIQPLEVYNGKYIAYSLGNFVFDQNFSEETMTGGLLKVFLEGKDIVSVALHEVGINGDFQPELKQKN
ncbi:MAG: CapA family protein [Candidatus Jorgensenbacteria bacterium]